MIVGIDTHKHEHVAVAINDLGARLATFRAPANGAGYADLVAWACTLGDLEAFGIEGTGSYAGSASPASCADRGSALSRSTVATGASGATTARVTRSTPRLPRGRCSPASRPALHRNAGNWCDATDAGEPPGPAAAARRGGPVRSGRAMSWYRRAVSRQGGR